MAPPSPLGGAVSPAGVTGSVRGAVKVVGADAVMAAVTCGGETGAAATGGGSAETSFTGDTVTRKAEIQTNRRLKITLHLSMVAAHSNLRNYGLKTRSDTHIGSSVASAISCPSTRAHASTLTNP